MSDPSTPHQRAVAAARIAAGRDDLDLTSEEIDAIVSAYLSEMQAAGWRMTPREATTDMITAAYEEDDGAHHFSDAWSAMWDAAPPVQGGEE